jgi:NAD-dependent SIR2 family protein deacetylase
MVTNYPQQLTATESLQTATPDVSVVSRVVMRLNQTLCGLSGHDRLVHIEGKRVTMRCSSCGHDTPGWEVTGRGPRRRFEGDVRRHQLTPSRDLSLRKTA